MLLNLQIVIAIYKYRWLHW